MTNNFPTQNNINYSKAYLSYLQQNLRKDTTVFTSQHHQQGTNIRKVHIIEIEKAMHKKNTNQASMAKTGALSDIAPTLLTMMGLAQPPEMTGKSLILLAN